MPSARYTFLNSTLVKEIARLGGDIAGLLPAHVEARLLARVRRRARALPDAGAGGPMSLHRYGRPPRRAVAAARLVLPEGEDPRIVRAPRALARERPAKVTSDRRSRRASRHVARAAQANLVGVTVLPVADARAIERTRAALLAARGERLAPARRRPLRARPRSCRPRRWCARARPTRSWPAPTHRPATCCAPRCG